ncbi:uncharacterized protein MYCGRDRAFT_69588 [Zymoseptoria tritici IPO323]|uniref:Transcription factor hoxa13 n=1 Tax=Zymoseptoria tritici (strain CBS 115943 / IPO323) TaxID=336722 RepID=F9X671_ZYMTI|nr:uncharacterized protein MYCGRDRAFT_69588 [Zymoseptoria tritici IPO323]EGP89489.1 hypothetical protein MYCGRDRAFT_69588 [Zymoseptoria tritici IPO323]
MNTQSNGVVVQRGRRRRGRRGSRTYSGWVIDKALKLFVWYSLVTVFFRCPAPENLTDDSPRICKPYLQAKDYVTPYAQPYYDQYLSPYVQKAQPYYESFNTHLYQPAQTAYTKHAAPRVADAQKISQQQWEKTVKPQLDVLQQQAGKQYQAVLGPHVKKATDVIQPYYNSVMNSASDIWELELAPVYRKTSPYAQKLYVQGQHFAVNTALPQAQYAGNVLWSFWSRYIWPKVRILYGENVEPQLMRITERLGRYKDGKKLEAGISSMEASSKLAEASSMAESIASSLSSTASVVTASPSSVASSAISASSAPTPDPDVDPTKHFHDDLKNWEQITAKAVEEGAEDLKERIKDITAHQVTSGGKVGEALVTQLERTSETALNTVKARIQGIVEDIPEDADDDRLERANEDLVKAIRAVGQTVKSRAQAVREWRQTSQSETENLIEKAVQSTLEVIDNIRELRLTEIGRKYSSTSLPHKEWSKYNDLKKATQTWRGQIEKAAQSHPGLKTAKAASEDIEQTGMAIAEDTAKELGRLKAVGKWKIAAADASDDFETKTIPAPMRRIKDQIVEKVAEASEASAPSAASKASSSVKSASSQASKSAQDAASQVSKSAQSAPSRASDSAQGAASKVSGSAETSSSAASVASQVSSALPDAEEIAASAESIASKASEAPKKVWGGAMAQVIVEAREPILDDDIVDGDGSYSASILSMVDVAQDYASELTKAVEDALKGAAPTQGTVESVTSLASEQYESALAAASSALFGTTQNAAERGTSIAHEQYLSAVTAASYAIYGTPVTAAPFAHATSAYSNAMSEAGQHYENAMSRISAKVSGTPAPVHEQMYASVESAYFAAVQAANGRFSNAFVPKTQGTYESISSIAASRLSDSLSAASAQYQSAKVAVGAKPTPVHQQYLASAQAAYYQALGVAHGRYSEFIDAASSAIAGSKLSAASASASSAFAAQTTEQAVLESVTSRASENWEALVSKASENIYGAPPPFTDAAYSQITSYGAQATDAAVAQWDQVSALFSELIVGKEPDFTDSVYSRLQSAYATGAPAALSSASSLLDEGASSASTFVNDGASSASSIVYDVASSASSYASEAYESAASAVSAVFVPPTEVPSILDQVTEQLNAAVEAASQQVYGTSAGYVEQASSAAFSAYDAASSAASSVVYGSPAGYADAAQSSFSDIGASASSAISAAMYGGPTPSLTAASNAAASVYSEVLDQAQKHASVASAAVSSRVYGEEKTYLEEVQARVAEAVASANSKLSELGVQATQAASGAASRVEEVVEQVTERIRDEL